MSSSSSLFRGSLVRLRRHIHVDDAWVHSSEYVRDGNRLLRLQMDDIVYVIDYSTQYATRVKVLANGVVGWTYSDIFETIQEL